MGFELFSFCKGSGVEVLVKMDIVGLVSLVRHNEWSTVVRYNNGKWEEKLFGGVYVRPGEKKEEVMEKLESWNECDMIAGDLNARQPVWVSGGGDNHKNTYGYAVNDYDNNHGYLIDIPNMPRFRDITVIDICLKKGNEESRWTDKAPLENQGIITRMDMNIPRNYKEPKIAWKKVDWKEVDVKGAPYREVNSKVATTPKLKVEDKDRVNNSRRIKTVKLNIVKLKASVNKFSRGKLVIKVECQALKFK